MQFIADPTPASSETSIDKLSSVLTDSAKSLWERYQALFRLRNIGTEESVQTLAKGFISFENFHF